MGASENNTTRSILEYLKYVVEPKHPAFFYRQNNIPAMQKMPNGQMRPRRMAKYTVNGTPDIVGTLYGSSIGIEVKTLIGKISRSQIEFRNKFEGAGGEYILARSVDDVEKWIKDFLQRLGPKWKKTMKKNTHV